MSIFNSNYNPIYLNKLKSKEKIQLNDFIKEKLRIINLSSNKRKMIINEENEIIKYIKNHKYPHNLSPLQQSDSINKKDNIKKKKTNINNRNEILNTKNNNNIKSIPLELKSFNTIDNNNTKKRRIFCNKSLNTLTPSYETFHDLRFLECKNEFEVKINELSEPLKIMIKNYPKKIKLPKLSKNIFSNNN